MNSLKSKIYVMLFFSMIFLFNYKIAICQNNVSGSNLKSTKSGVSEALLKEYADIISKYHIVVNNKASWENFKKNVSITDKHRLKEIYTNMNDLQQQQQFIICRAAMKPLPKLEPTIEQLKSWKNENVYGVWVDGKKIDNKELNNFTSTDFDQFFVSKLYSNAKQGKKYAYQVDLMTKKYYKNYLDERLSKGDIDFLYKYSDKNKNVLSF